MGRFRYHTAKYKKYFTDYSCYKMSRRKMLLKKEECTLC